jgi:tryptophan synthase beta subunit
VTDEGRVGGSGYDVVSLSGRGDKDLAEVLGLESV